MNLRTPGPTPIPPAVQEAMGRQMINHRGPEFSAVMASLRRKLPKLFQTEHEVLIFSASGTGGLEAATVNVLSPGDQVLSATCGYFGDRWADLAEAYGAQVTRLSFPWGQAVDPQAIAAELRKRPGVKAVFVTHNETSTGVTNDMAAISSVVHRTDALLLVDAISSIPAIDLPADRLGCDVVIAGSQKAWMIPPGLTMLSVGPRAWEAVAKARMPRYYFDFTACRDTALKGETPFTPAVSLYVALDVATDMILEEGLAQFIARHNRIGKLCRDGVRALGLAILPDEAHASNTVSAVKVPDGVDGGALVKILREEYGIVVAAGQGPLRGKIFRIGHLGYVSEPDIQEVLQALRAVLARLSSPSLSKQTTV